MKRSTEYLAVFVVIYLLVNILFQMMESIPKERIIETLVDIKCQQMSGHKPTAGEVKQLVKGTSYHQHRWPYNVSVTEYGTNWTLRFEPKPLEFWRRIWWAFAGWNFTPTKPSSYEMNSESMIVKITHPNGNTSFMLDDLKTRTSEPPSGGDGVPAQRGTPSQGASAPQK